MQNVDPLRNDIQDFQLDDETQIDILTIGLKETIGSTGDQGVGIPRIIWRASGYSDEFIHGAIIPGAPDHISFVQDFVPDVFL